MPFAWIGAGAAVVGAATQVYGAATAGSKQSGAISGGQVAANAVMKPYVDTGTNALLAYGDAAGLNGPDGAARTSAAFTGSPGYQWALGEGLRGVDAGAAAKGMTRSGATLKGELAYGEGLASQDFNSYISRLNDLANKGLSASGTTASTDTSAAGQQASIYGNQTKGVTDAVGGLLGNRDVRNGLASLYSGSGVAGDTTVLNPNVLGGSYRSNANPDLNF